MSTTQDRPVPEPLLAQKRAPAERTPSTERPRRARPVQTILKRGIDVVVAGVLLVILSPAMVVIVWLVRRSSPGPAIYRQVRVGRHGRAIVVRKFRSMYVGAHAQRQMLTALNEADGPLFKVRRDPRVTPIGSVLRRYSLDELPQLVNVLCGSMSLVGPRPALPEEAAAHPGEMRERLLVKPGLTGLWQVSGRSDLSWSQAVRLDRHYAERWTLWLDLVILVRTIPAVVLARGAY